MGVRPIDPTYRPTPFVPSTMDETGIRADLRANRPQPKDENKQVRWHAKKHLWPESYKDCRRCQRAEAVCHSKLTYLSRDAAFISIDQIHWRDQWARPLVSYCCRVCGWWHLATAFGPKELKKSRRHWRRSLAARGLDTSPGYGVDITAKAKP